MQLLHGGTADAATRGVEDALESEVVGRLVDQAEIGERVADLLALVKARPADDAIGQCQGDEPLFELARLETGAYQDRNLAQRVALALQGLDLLADPAGFLLGVPHRTHHDLLALTRFGPQRLAEPPSVLRDHPRGGTQDVRGRAIVLLEPGDRGPGEIGLETQDVADLRTAPTIDRLVVVADATEIAALLGQQAQPQILGDVGVLVLVDEQIAEASLVVGEDVQITGEQGQVMEQEVAEIDGVHRHQALLILAIEVDRAAAGEVAGVVAPDFFGTEPTVLPTLDDGEQQPRRPAPFVDVLHREDLLQEANLVVGVENRKARLQPDQLGVPAQDA